MKGHAPLGATRPLAPVIGRGGGGPRRRAPLTLLWRRRRTAPAAAAPARAGDRILHCHPLWKFDISLHWSLFAAPAGRPANDSATPRLPPRGRPAAEAAAARRVPRLVPIGPVPAARRAAGIRTAPPSSPPRPATSVPVAALGRAYRTAARRRQARGRSELMPTVRPLRPARRGERMAEARAGTIPPPARPGPDLLATARRSARGAARRRCPAALGRAGRALAPPAPLPAAARAAAFPAGAFAADQGESRRPGRAAPGRRHRIGRASGAGRASPARRRPEAPRVPASASLPGARTSAVSGSVPARAAAASIAASGAAPRGRRRAFPVPPAPTGRQPAGATAPSVRGSKPLPRSQSPLRRSPAVRLSAAIAAAADAGAGAAARGLTQRRPRRRAAGGIGGSLSPTFGRPAAAQRAARRRRATASLSLVAPRPFPSATAGPAATPASRRPRPSLAGPTRLGTRRFAEPAPAPSSMKGAAGVARLPPAAVAAAPVGAAAERPSLRRSAATVLRQPALQLADSLPDAMPPPSPRAARPAPTAAWPRAPRASAGGAISERGRPPRPRAAAAEDRRPARASLDAAAARGAHAFRHRSPRLAPAAAAVRTVTSPSRPAAARRRRRSDPGSAPLRAAGPIETAPATFFPRRPARSAAMRFAAPATGGDAPPTAIRAADRRARLPVAGSGRVRRTEAPGSSAPFAPLRVSRSAPRAVSLRRAMAEPAGLPGAVLRRRRAAAAPSRFERLMVETGLPNAAVRRRPVRAAAPLLPITVRPKGRPLRAWANPVERILAPARNGRPPLPAAGAGPALAARRPVPRSADLQWANGRGPATAMLVETAGGPAAAVAASAPALAAPAAAPVALPPPPAPDMDRLVDEVVRRIERHARSERQRRGL